MKNLLFLSLLALFFSPSLAFVNTHFDSFALYAADEIEVPPADDGDVEFPPAGDGDVETERTKKICTSLDKTLSDAGRTLEDDIESSIVPCGRIVHQCDQDTENDQCGFSHLFVLVNNLVRRFIMIVFAPLLTIILMYIGFLFIKEQAAAKAKAKALLWRVLVGTFFVLAAWLIVNFILSALGADSELSRFLTE